MLGVLALASLLVVPIPTSGWIGSAPHSDALSELDAGTGVQHLDPNRSIRSAASLAVALAANVTSGPFPLAVFFEAVPSGGTGNYTTPLWTFGDGTGASALDVPHTYASAGVFVARFSVVDSAGDAASGALNVTAAAASPLPRHSSSSPTVVLGSGLTAGLGLVGVGLGVRWWQRSRARSLGHEIFPESPADGPPVPEVRTTPADPGAIGGRPAERSGISSPPTAPLPSGAVGTSPLAPIRPVDRAPESSEPRSGAVRLGDSKRPEVRRAATREIVRHLANLGRLDATEVAPVGRTQQGIGEKLDMPQNSVSRLLLRLEAAGVVSGEVQHVRGRPRRVKVYSLTDRGEGLAREYRRPTAGPGPREEP